MTSRTNDRCITSKQVQKEPPNRARVEERRHQAMARYLAGDKIEAICRELGCSKSWLYKWRNRYRANHPTWVQERSRRPRSNARQLPGHLEALIVHLARSLASRETGRASVREITQALKEQAIAPLPSRRTIYRVLQRHDTEVNEPISPPSQFYIEAL